MCDDTKSFLCVAGVSIVFALFFMFIVFAATPSFVFTVSLFKYGAIGVISIPILCLMSLFFDG